MYFFLKWALRQESVDHPENGTAECAVQTVTVTGKRKIWPLAQTVSATASVNWHRPSMSQPSIMAEEEKKTRKPKG